jgi:hypothetical protein
MIRASSRSCFVTCRPTPRGFALASRDHSTPHSEWRRSSVFQKNGPSAISTTWRWKTFLPPYRVLSPVGRNVGTIPWQGLPAARRQQDHVTWERRVRRGRESRSVSITARTGREGTTLRRPQSIPHTVTLHDPYKGGHRSDDSRSTTRDAQKIDGKQPLRCGQSALAAPRNRQ